jgi:predicted deacylase
MAKTVGGVTQFSIGGIRVAPGSTASGYVPVATRLDGSTLSIPVIIVHGAQAGPVLCVDACCHGDEHEGMLAVLRLTRSLDPVNLRGTFIGVMALNIPAVEAMQRGNPFDHWHSDLNRLFPGDPEGNLTQRTAYTYINEIAGKADYSISVHSGASYIYWSPQGVCGQEKASVELAQGLGEEWDVLWQQGGERAPLAGNCMSALNAQGVAAILIEVGGAAERLLHHFDHNVNYIVNGITNVMRTLGMVDGPATRANCWTLVRQRAVRSGTSGIIVPEPNLRLRAYAEKDTPLLRLYNLLGQEVEVVTAPVDGLVMGIRTFQYCPPGWPLVWMGEITGKLP